MRSFLPAVVAGCLVAGGAFAVNPSSVKITIYAVAVSPNADCSGAIAVASFPAGVEYDFLSPTNPQIANGFLPAGTYPCVILQMSDVLKYTSAATTGTCTAGIEYTRDVCRAGAGNYSPMSINEGGTVSFGASTACTGSLASPANDRVPLFLTTASDNSGQAFLVPSGAANGRRLEGAFVVSASSIGTFVVDFNGKIDGSGGSCDVQPPVFGFR